MNLGNQPRMEGKVVIVTGGASGIGEASVRMFARNGAKVIIADIQDDLGQALELELKGMYGSDDVALFVHCDVTRDADVSGVVDFAVAKHGKLDVMFNNAGIAGKPVNSILDTDNEEFRQVFDLNVYGCFLGAKHAARVMIPAKKGVILFTASVASVCCGTAPHAYTMSKHAVVGLMKNLCVDLGQHGIRVNCISPTALATPLTAKYLGVGKESMEAYFREAANLKGITLVADDVAEAAVFLASEQGRYVSGLNLLVDGGFSTTNTSFSSVPKNF